VGVNELSGAVGLLAFIIVAPRRKSARTHVQENVIESF